MNKSVIKSYHFDKKNLFKYGLLHDITSFIIQ